MTRRSSCGDEPAPALRTGHHPVDRLFELGQADLVETPSTREQRSFVHEVREVGAGEPGRAARDDGEVDALGERLAARVHCENRLAPFQVGPIHDDLAVEPSRSEQRGIEDVRPVRRREQDHADLRIEAIHLNEELVQRLLALVVTAADACAAMAADRVDLVDEHDRRRGAPSPSRRGRGPWRHRPRRTSRRSPSR